MLNIEHCDAKKKKTSSTVACRTRPHLQSHVTLCTGIAEPIAAGLLSIPCMRRPATKDQWLPIIRLGIPRCVFAFDIVESDRDRQMGVSSPGMDRCRNQPLFLRLPAVGGLCVSQPQSISLLPPSKQREEFGDCDGSWMCFRRENRIVSRKLAVFRPYVIRRKIFDFGSQQSSNIHTSLHCRRRIDFVSANEPDTPMQRAVSVIIYPACRRTTYVAGCPMSLISNTTVMRRPPSWAGGYSPRYLIGFIVRGLHYDCVMTWHDGGEKPRCVLVLAGMEWGCW
jgi:hypothetical protein